MGIMVYQRAAGYSVEIVYRGGNTVWDTYPTWDEANDVANRLRKAWGCE